MPKAKIIQADVMEGLGTLPDESVQCVITSPPYWGLRDYGCDGQIGVEDLHDCLGWAKGERCGECYVCRIVDALREVRRVLRGDGLCFLNLGDCYAGSGKAGNNPEYWGKHKEFGHLTGANPGRFGKAMFTPPRGLKTKDRCGIPERVVLASQADGWWWRSEVIWNKPNPMPSSVTDRPTDSHEKVYLLSKSERYFWDQEAVKEEAGPFHAGGPNNALDHPKTPDPRKKQDALGKNTYTGFNARWRENPTKSRNIRSVWTIATEPFPEAHFATFPKLLVEPMVKAGTSEKGCCPDCGSPWERSIAKRVLSAPYQDAEGARQRKRSEGVRKGGVNHVTLKADIRTQTIGFRPTCQCYIRALRHVDFTKSPEDQSPAGKAALGEAKRIPCVVLDPFAGAGTTGVVACKLERDFVGIELSPEYAKMAADRIKNDQGFFNEVHISTKL
jgi:DNA modification methylase